METIKVKDLMVPLEQYVCVSEEATLYEAVVALEAAQARNASVVTRTGRFSFATRTTT